MTEEIKQEQKAPESEQKTPENKSVGATAHYKQQLEATNAKIAELMATNEKLSKTMEQKEADQLASQNNFKQLYENSQVKIGELEESNIQKDNNISTYVKMSEIKKEALKAGIKAEAIDDLDFIDKGIVTVETTSSGNISVNGAKELIQSLKESKNHWFTEKGAPNVNNANPEAGGSGELTVTEILALQKKDPAKYKEVMAKKINKS